MRVTEIDISDLHFLADGNRHEGYVSMTVVRDGNEVQLQFHCRADQPGDCPATLVTQALIEDALRQAYRMPGFRRGERRIKVEAPQPKIAARLAPA